MMTNLLRAVFLLVAGLLWDGWATAQPAATAAISASPEYRLAAGDVVRITVYQNPDLSLDARVGENGTLTFPLLGNVKVGGLTIGESQKVIADGLSNGRFVKDPQVNVLVMQVRGNQVSVLGQVNRPGRYPIEVADMHLSDLLALAGGIATTGADSVTVVGMRSGKRFRKEIDVNSIFRSDSADADIPIQSGDVAYVERAPMVYIYGQVQRAGPMRLEPGMTVMQALATGGGLTPRGTERGVRVHRKAADGKIDVIQPTLDDKVRDGDVIYVRESLF